MSHSRTWLQASAIGSGRENTRGFVTSRRRAVRDDHGIPTRAVPQSRSSSQERIASWCGPAIRASMSTLASRRITGSRQTDSAKASASEMEVRLMSREPPS